MKSLAVLRIEIVLLASYKILLDFARVHATNLLQLASRTIELISYPPIQTVKISFVGCRFQMFASNSGPEFLVGDLQLYLNLQSVVIKMTRIDSFVEQSGGKYIM